MLLLSTGIGCRSSPGRAEGAKHGEETRSFGGRSRLGGQERARGVLLCGGETPGTVEESHLLEICSSL